MLANACAVVGVATAFAVAFPFNPTSPRVVDGAIAVVAWSLWAALRFAADRVRAWQLHAVLILATVAVTLSLAASASEFSALVTSVCMVWIAIFSGVFHRPAVLARYLTAVAAGLAVGLHVADVPSPFPAWVFLVATVVGIGATLNRRVSALRREAMTDPLTGAFTRRAFERAAELDMARASRTGMPLSLAVIDLDDFKRVNDKHGHTFGDEVLVGLVTQWQASVPREVVLGRLGGDEFGLLMPGETLEEATAVVASLSDDLCAWSAGVVQWDGGMDLIDLLRAADADMYATKARFAVGNCAAAGAAEAAGTVGGGNSATADAVIDSEPSAF